MANGFGAGFLTLGLQAALAGIAVLLVAIAAVGWLARRRTGRTPRAVRPLAAALLVAVVVSAGFGVLALADEAAVGAALLVATVFVPLAAVGLRTRATAAAGTDRMATAALAWGGPYLLGAIAFVGINAAVPQWFDLAPGEARAIGLGWIAVLVAGAVATAGALGVGPAMAELNDRG